MVPRPTSRSDRIHGPGYTGSSSSVANFFPSFVLNIYIFFYIWHFFHSLILRTEISIYLHAIDHNNNVQVTGLSKVKVLLTFLTKVLCSDSYCRLYSVDCLVESLWPGDCLSTHRGRGSCYLTVRAVQVLRSLHHNICYSVSWSCLAQSCGTK